MIKYVVLILFLVLKFFTLENCFFWDNTAGYSMPASYLLENGFLSFVYPAQYVADPPLAHLYLALLWSLFGKSLLVAHLSITVFSLGVIWQVYRLCGDEIYTLYIFVGFIGTGTFHPNDFNFSGCHPVFFCFVEYQFDFG